MNTNAPHEVRGSNLTFHLLFIFKLSISLFIILSISSRKNRWEPASQKLIHGNWPEKIQSMGTGGIPGIPTADLPVAKPVHRPRRPPKIITSLNYLFNSFFFGQIFFELVKFSFLFFCCLQILLIVKSFTFL